VYVKGSLIDGTAIWVVSETKIPATLEKDFYYFEWGQVLAPIEGERIVQTSYGSTYVTHNPVTVNPASAAFASIDPNTQMLTVNEQAGGDSHNPVTIATESAALASIDENQVLTINEQIPTGFIPLQAVEDTKGLTGFVNPSDIDVSYNWTNRTITLTGVLDYYWRGVKKTLVSQWTSSAHANTVGKWFLYSTDGINFIWSNDIWDFSYVMVSAVNYKATNAESFAICETHGTMDYLSHEEDHQVNGTYLLSGGKATAGTYIYDTATDAANSPGFDLARLKDEDRETDVPAWVEGTYTTMYVGASSTSVFNIVATLPFISSGSYIQINDPLTGAMNNGINLRFYNVYQVLIPATSDSPSQKFRTIFLQPQKVFSSLAEAELEDANGLYFGELQTLTAEFKIYSRLTYKTSAGDANTGKCRLMGISYVTGTKGNPINIGGFVPTDHANLSNVIWTDSAHSGTANKLAGFGSGGEAVEVDPTPAQVNGLGMSATVIGDLGLPSEVNSTSVNEVTATSHTHQLGNISVDNVIKSFDNYGALYNWYAATDARKITSSDAWYVLSIDDFIELGLFCGGEEVVIQDKRSITIAGQKLTEAGASHWNNNTTGTDDFNFSIIGSGAREGGFWGLRDVAYILALGDTGLPQNKYGVSVNLYSSLFGEFAYVIEEAIATCTGIALRLVRAASESELLLVDGAFCDDYVDNCLQHYKTVKIGTKIYTSQNLNERKYRNGDWIHGFDNGVYAPISDADWDLLTSEAMCYYMDYSLGIPVLLPEVLANIKHNDRPDLDGGDPANNFYGHLTEAELTKVQGLPETFLAVGDWYEDIAFEFADVVAGTAKTYTLDISAIFAYNIISAFLETDNGTLTGVAVKIGSTAVTSLSSVTVDTAVDETTATGANAVAIGNRVYLAVAATYTGAPTLIRGKLKIQRT